MLFAKGREFSQPPIVTEDVGRVIGMLLILCILAWFLFIISFMHRGAKPALVALATGSVLGMLIGAAIAFFQWHSQAEEFGQPIEAMMIECFLRKPMLAFFGCVGMTASWLSLLIFGKRTSKMDT